MKLFGTDGIRGVYGSGFFTQRNILKFGFISGTILKHRYEKFKPGVLIGRDTRYSSEIIQKKLTAGFELAGLSVDNLGVIPTPAVSYLTFKKKYLAGVVVSASHNPWRDNGIKFFSHTGEKLPESVESEIENRFFETKNLILDAKKPLRPQDVRRDLLECYFSFLKNSADPSGLSGFKVVIDCANGSTSYIAPSIFKLLGAKCIVLNSKPSGKNINKNCGSLHPEAMQRAVVKYKADCGISFDGDGDRAVFCDQKGKLINGDQIIGGYSVYLKEKGELTKNSVVVTVMSNFGFLKEMRDRGIDIITVPVGDKYVWEAMKDSGAVIGGEQSGHIIFKKFAKTGDGILTALLVLSAMKETGKKLSEFAGFIRMCPQVLLNLKVKKKIPLEKLTLLSSLIKKEQEKISESGRIFVRYSGTEPLLRIMVEGSSLGRIKKIAERLKKAAQKDLKAWSNLA